MTFREAPYVASVQLVEHPQGAAPYQCAWDRENEVAIDAVRVVYCTHGPAVFRFLRRLLGDQSLDAEALQETFARALTSYDRLRDPRQPRPWVFGIARHVASEMRKRRKRVSQLEHNEGPELLNQLLCPSPTPEQRAMDTQILAALRIALHALSEDRRTALLLRAEHGLEYREIAIAMNWSLSKSKVEVMRARKMLRTSLEEQLGTTHDL